ncbi:hypothetical protein H6G45_16215 [Synechocystis sp. FACHB-383]|uniref:hypothetical protein n=1 Tax=Synechocystis sp. FACHB-383 TaxID=2692864 RepID=UPI001686F4A6|nr:hypothetical protein [Synechocystis sp. FACHB-383]MBD2654999.1 hypothetical protein [Synechocystis sp. FACHB-383]
MARKSKEFQRLFHEETHAKKSPRREPTPQSIRKKELAAYDQFKEKLENDEQNKGITFVEKPKGMRKMSMVLEQFVAPFLDDEDSYEEREFFFELAVLAWNCAVFPESGREKLMESFFSGLANPLDPESMEATQDLRVFVEELIERKLDVFPKDNRIIQDFQLTQHEAGFHISVSYVIAR